MKKGAEAQKSHQYRLSSGFYHKYMQGCGLDIGYKGYEKDIEPILDTAIGVDLSYPGYDGKILPFKSSSQDYIFNSHVLEHIADYKQAIREWYRVTKINGHIVIIVPHQFLYEKKEKLPSKWNGDHKRFYTPSSLLREIEESLDPNSYRIMHLRDNDYKNDYTLGPDVHGNWCYEIECVIKKINIPKWELS